MNYAIVVSTCAGMWATSIGDTVRFESLDPPLLSFTGRTRYTLSAFGEHLISEEVEGAIASGGDGHRRGGARLARRAGLLRGAGLSPVRRRVPQSSRRIPMRFRDVLDADLSRRNADYLAHRAPGVGLPSPALLVARPGGFDGWMRHRGKLGGQNKVPRMDNAGTLTRDLLAYLDGQPSGWSQRAQRRSFQPDP